MSNKRGWSDPRHPHPLSHMPDRLTLVPVHSGPLADLEALVWNEVQSQALRGKARRTAPARATARRIGAVFP